MTPDPARPADRARVTIAEVAREAGVSLGTASDALRGTGRVSAATREKVAAAASGLGYRPSRAARSLRLGRQGAVALALPPHIDRPGDFLEVDYYMGIAAGMASTAFERGIVISLIPDDRVRLGTVADIVDGVVLSDPDVGDPRLRALTDNGIPVVTIDHDLGLPEHRWWITSDHRANTRMLLDHLAEGGAENVLLLSGVPRWSWLADTEEAYAEWARERGAQVRIERLGLADRFAFGAAAATAAMEGGDPPDAIVANAEHFALGALAGLRALGVSVPGEVQVAASVDGSGARYSDPSITTVDLQPVEQGRIALGLLMDQLAGSAPPARAPVVPAVLRVRASTRAAGPVPA